MKPHKTYIRKTGIIALLLVAVFQLGATPIAIAKKEKDLGDPYKKVYEEEYSANSSSTLNISTSFSDVDITSWNQNKISIHVECTVESKNEKRANEMLEDIKVDLKQKGNDIWVEAEFSGNSKGNESFDIDITIKAPAGITGKIEQSFGDLSIKDISGPLYIEASYGGVELTNCTSSESNVDMAFGGIEIDYFHGKEISIAYGDAEIGRVEAPCSLDNGFGELMIGNITGSGHVEINNGYGNTHVTTFEHFNFDCTSSYGSVKVNGNVTITTQDKDWFTEKISGGDQNANIQIVVDNSFGDVTIISKN